MTGEQLCVSTSFRYDSTRLSQMQVILTLILGIGAIRVAFLIYRRQNKNSKKDAILNRALQKVIMLTIDINTGQRKLEHLSNHLKQSEESNNTNAIIELNKGLCELQCSLDNYYKSRDEALDLYDKEIQSK